MEMVSAAKMRRAVDNALGTRSYAELALELLVNISRDQQVRHPLLQAGTKGRILAIIIASNKGLCGSYNASIAKTLKNFASSEKEAHIDYITVGKRAENFVKKISQNVIASFIEFPDDLKIENISGLSKLTINEFSTQKYERVVMVYTNFVSSLKYVSETRNLLPISEKNIKSMIADLGHGGIEEKDMRLKNLSLYLFEPDEETILTKLLPRLTEVQIYQALLESIASEHSARMIAMRNASDNAEEMMNELELSFNQARQASITQEIAEIASGAAALG